MIGSRPRPGCGFRARVSHGARTCSAASSSEVPSAICSVLVSPFSVTSTSHTLGGGEGGGYDIGQVCVREATRLYYRIDRPTWLGPRARAGTQTPPTRPNPTDRLTHRLGSSFPATSTSVEDPSELMKRRVLAAAPGCVWWLWLAAGMGGRKAAVSAGSARSTAAVAARMVFVEGVG